MIGLFDHALTAEVGWTMSLFESLLPGGFSVDDNTKVDIQGGYRVAEEASAAMQGIVSRVEEVRAIIADIAVASRQQSAGIEQVGTAVTQIGEATQQNAALVEEAAGVARTLEAQAASLDGAVSAFKLDGGTARRQPLKQRSAGNTRRPPLNPLRPP